MRAQRTTRAPAGVEHDLCSRCGRPAWVQYRRRNYCRRCIDALVATRARALTSKTPPTAVYAAQMRGVFATRAQALGFLDGIIERSARAVAGASNVHSARESLALYRAVRARIAAGR
jgi:hypothetical protein